MQLHTVWDVLNTESAGIVVWYGEDNVLVVARFREVMVVAADFPFYFVLVGVLQCNERILQILSLMYMYYKMRVEAWGIGKVQPS